MDAFTVKQTLKAVCHVSDWPLQSEFNTTDFFVNLCIWNKGELIFLNFYGHRKWEDHQPFKFPILCIVIINQSNAWQTAFKVSCQICPSCHSNLNEHLVQDKKLCTIAQIKLVSKFETYLELINDCNKRQFTNECSQPWIETGRFGRNRIPRSDRHPCGRHIPPVYLYYGRTPPHSVEINCDMALNAIT